MSLQVWLPLNGNINNQGIDFAATISCNKQEYTTGGKLCNKYFTSSSTISVTTIPLKSSRIWSYCYWGYIKSSLVTTNWTKISGVNDGGSWLRTEVCPSSFSNGIYCYSVHNNSANALTNNASSSPTGGYYDQRVHFCLTCDGTTITKYMNGTKINTLPYNGSGVINGTFSFDNNHIIHKQDVRIYDHCLSAREIKEISKGLFLHYPLSSPYTTTLTNKYSGDNAEGKGSSGDFTITKLANERGYNYKFSYTGTGSNKWMSMYFPNVTFTAGKIYDYSCKTRLNSNSNVSFYFRASRMSNDWVTSTQNVCSNKGKWIEHHIRLTLAATSDRSGTSYDTRPLIEFYTNNMVTSGTVYSLDIDIKDIQIVESPDNNDIPFHNSSYKSSTMNDTSGYLSTAIPSGTIGYSSDSPRYDGSYVFSDTSHFKLIQPLVSPSQFTCSFWVKPTSLGSYAIVTSNYNNPASGFWIAVNCEGYGLWFYNGSYARNNKGLLTLNTWYHACLVFKDGVFTWYQNGEAAGTTDLSSKSKTLGIADTIGIGNSYTGTQWNTKFNGNISDFRMYSTALSATDVKELYNTPISLTNTGTLMTQGEFKEV